MSENEVRTLSYTSIVSFVGEASVFSDPLKDAVANATQKANKYLETLDDNEMKSKVISTNTHLIMHGDYFSYIITLTVETHELVGEKEGTNEG